MVMDSKNSCGVCWRIYPKPTINTEDSSSNYCVHCVMWKSPVTCAMDVYIGVKSASWTYQTWRGRARIRFGQISYSVRTGEAFILWILRRSNPSPRPACFTYFTVNLSFKPYSAIPCHATIFSTNKIWPSTFGHSIGLPAWILITYVIPPWRCWLNLW